jgi:hypothetical protein
MAIYDEDLDVSPSFQKIVKTKRSEEGLQNRKKPGSKHVDKRSMYVEA